MVGVLMGHILPQSLQEFVTREVICWGGTHGTILTGDLNVNHARFGQLVFLFCNGLAFDRYLT